jgi:hypothetical protein
VRAKAPEERREEVLELVRAPVDAGGFEEPARGERLERLDEAAVRLMLEEALDRPGAGFRHDLRLVLVALVPEAQRRAKGEEERGQEMEDDGLGRMMRGRPRDDSIRGAEVEAERARCHEGA